MMLYRAAKTLILAAACAGVAAGMLARDARAGDIYVETGLGASSISHGRELFETALPGTLSVGFGITVGVFYNLSNDNSAVQFHFGLKDRISTGHDGTSQYVLHIPYPVFRVELSHLYLGAGLAPWAFTREGSLLALRYNSHPGATAHLAELGFLWKVVPYFHLAVEGAVEYVTPPGSTAFSPQPAMTFALQMRFFTGLTESGAKGSGGRQYDGWRYPFGIEIGK